MPSRMTPRLTSLALLIASWPISALAQPAIKPEPRYQSVARAVSAFIQGQQDAFDIPAVMVALVDDQRIVWAAGFGLADPARNTPASAQTVVRVGSVSKLYTDVALMQLVEEGLVDLDAPITTYLPDFHPKNPFQTPITLRQLVSHRAGLVREPPVGHYFDPSEPSLRESVASLNRTTLVYEPGTHTKYSNAGLNVVGRVVEVVRHKPFAETVQETVLKPLGMTDSSFDPAPDLQTRLAKARMWTYDGRTFDAPTFDLGLQPAGNLASTVLDQSRFLSALFADGQGAHGRILRPETLQSMTQPQADGPFGLGFHVGSFKGTRLIGHDGAVYGFVTSFLALPEEKLGVVVVATTDCASEVVSPTAFLALKGMLLARDGVEILPLVPRLQPPLPLDVAKRLRGPYRSPQHRLDLDLHGRRLLAWHPDLGIRVEFAEDTSPRSQTLVGVSPITFSLTLRVEGDTLVRLDQSGGDQPEGVSAEIFKRLPDLSEPPPPPRDAWQGLLGEYGWDHDVLYILEDHGQLHALIEWFFLYPLEQVQPNLYRFPDSGLYAGESLRFERDARDRATKAILGDSVVFKRRSVGPEPGQTFRIQPAQPVKVLRAQALAAEPPAEKGEFRKPELVDLAALDPSIKLDIRYAGTNNFLGSPMYSSARAFLQKPAAESLLKAHRNLKASGYGLLIHDAYRPWYVTRMFWDATRGPDRGFVADPSEGSRHNRGCAVDLSLYDLATGQPVSMVSGYDEFSPRARPDYPGGSARQRWLRDLLRRQMEAQGFSVNPGEWWHFDHHDWPAYPILNTPFETLLPAPQPPGE